MEKSRSTQDQGRQWPKLHDKKKRNRNPPHTLLERKKRKNSTGELRLLPTPSLAMYPTTAIRFRRSAPPCSGKRVATRRSIQQDQPKLLWAC
mmetsp:Transcript_27100/g.65773  ORF Transcript_27100/g.65773 Transcript_27100/m.65773 type:complete len:92 (-) Transcript_27100:1705-1980(-)